MNTKQAIYLDRKIWSLPALLSALFVLVAQNSFAQKITSLEGKWQLQDQSATVNIAPCINSSNLCATVIDEVVPYGEKSNLGLIMLQDIVRDPRNNGWRGKFVDGKTTLNATVTEKGTDTVDFKFCVLVILCDVQTYNRVN
jgi:uncharacterized protein (DUF2147 family)